MGACAGRNKPSENKSDRKHQNPDLPFDDRSYKRKEKCYEEDQRSMNAKIRPNDALSITTLYDLPLEMLDVILQKSYLHWILNSSTKPRDEDVIRSLISVDVCFNKRITRQRFKKAIRRYLKKFYGKTKKRHAIIRNNRSYLENNIELNDELLASLLLLNCITEEQSRFIQRQRSIRDKNNELLYVMESFDETNFANLINYLRRTNQRTVTKIIENGGGVTKVKVNNRSAKCKASMETQHLFHQKINDLRDRTKPRSHETDKLIAQLRAEDIEILSSQMDRQTVVVWIWCHSKTSIENLQRLYESNQLRDVYFDNIQPSRPTSRVIIIERNQFKKTTVVRPITINVTQRIDMPEYETNELMSPNKNVVRPVTINVTQRIDMSEYENVLKLGVTKLRNEINVLFHTSPAAKLYVSGIHVFEDRYPFRLQTDIVTEKMKSPRDIVSSEKENCLYVSDDDENCVWKITRETDDQHKIVKWLTTDYEPRKLSVAKDGELLMINHPSPYHLMIYGSDAELIRSIPLTKDIKNPQHAVETSIGNFIIIDIHEEEKDKEEHKEEDEDEQEDEVEDENEEGEEEDGVMTEEGKRPDWLESRQGKGESNSRMMKETCVVSELTRDGQMIIRSFIPSDKTHPLTDSYYLLIDSDDRVFVADDGNYKMILLDSDLKSNQILCPTKEEDEKQILLLPYRLFYDEEMKQLIVVGRFEAFGAVYSLSRN